jgi:hypothetical protein
MESIQSTPPVLGGVLLVCCCVLSFVLGHLSLVIREYDGQMTNDEGHIATHNKQHTTKNEALRHHYRVVRKHRGENQTQRSGRT